MSQGQAKKVKGQQASADSSPSVLSTEQEAILSSIYSALYDLNAVVTGAPTPAGGMLDAGIRMIGSDGENYQYIKTDTDGKIQIGSEQLEMILRQLRNRIELTPTGNIKVELQSTGTSPVTVTSGAITSLGAASTDQSFNVFMAQNLLFRTQLSQILI